MPCVNPDGTIEPVARALLQALRTPAAPAALAGQVGVPLYRIRSGLRELAQAGLVAEQDGRYAVTAAGQARLAEVTWQPLRHPPD